MKLQSIKQGENTVIWYINDTNCAEVATVSKGHTGWSLSFRETQITGFGTRAVAIKDAKRVLTKYHTQGGN